MGGKRGKERGRREGGEREGREGRREGGEREGREGRREGDGRREGRGRMNGGKGVSVKCLGGRETTRYYTYPAQHTLAC